MFPYLLGYGGGGYFALGSRGGAFLTRRASKREQQKNQGAWHGRAALFTPLAAFPNLNRSPRSAARESGQTPRKRAARIPP